MNVLFRISFLFKRGTNFSDSFLYVHFFQSMQTLMTSSHSGSIIYGAISKSKNVSEAWHFFCFTKKTCLSCDVASRHETPTPVDACCFLELSKSVSDHSSSVICRQILKPKNVSEAWQFSLSDAYDRIFLATLRDVLRRQKPLTFVSWEKFKAVLHPPLCQFQCFFGLGGDFQVRTVVLDKSYVQKMRILWQGVICGTFCMYNR